MKVTQVAICPSEASRAAGRPALTPELLAASGARYSRNNEGLEAILARVDYTNLDQSVDAIFRMIDYGHQSIADMAPVAIFIDGLSFWLAYYVWSLCPTAGGQESSTRYIKLSVDEMIAPEMLGIPCALHDEWRGRMDACYAAYRGALAYWEALAQTRPQDMRIPQALLDDTSEKCQKQVARMRRNFAFDRARYFLPTAAATNMMMLMPARGWVQLCQHLLSHVLPEAQQLGNALRQELALSAPRLLRHANANASIAQGLRDEFHTLQQQATSMPAPFLEPGAATCEHPSTAYLDVFAPTDVPTGAFANDLTYHDNRYAWQGGSLKRTAVRFGWEAVTFGEIRDLNRHRTGTKYCPLIPLGFYAAQDQLPGEIASKINLAHLETGRTLSARARELLTAGDPSYPYWTALGTQYRFEHTTTADKFLYEAELRTGTGAHYRYARHFRDILQLWYTKFPETRGLILEGSGEPE